MYNENSTGQVIANRMPHTITTSGFSHNSASGSGLVVSYIATGKKT